MKNKKKIIIILVSALAAIALALTLYLTFKNENRLTISEKEWLSDNSQSVLNFSIVNDINVFGKDGKGVFFDLLTDFSEKYGLTINNIPYNYGTTPGAINFSLKQDVEKNDLILFEDHYVLVGLSDISISKTTDLSSVKIGVLKSDLLYLQKYLPNLNYVPYDNNVVLMDDLKSNDEISYLIVSNNMFANQILSNDYYINYHFSDIPMYYVMSFAEDDIICSIMTKFGRVWLEKNYDESYNKHNVKLYLTSLSISEKDKDILTNKVYNYGLTMASPFEEILSSSYGGITSIYLDRFTKFSGVEFKYINYKSPEKLLEAATTGEIDLYFNYYNLESKFQTINTSLNANIAIIAREDNYLVVNNLKSLTGKTVYALKNSSIYSYLAGLGYVNVLTFSDEDELIDLSDDGKIFAIEEASYLYLKNEELEDYSMRYSEEINVPYAFKLNGDATFNKLFSKYLRSLDPNEIKYEGIENYRAINKSGSFIVQIAKYALFIIIAGLAILFFYVKSKKRVRVSKKIKKEDKIRFIDMLTSLKNRNYLNENISGWNNNTIYPQAAVVVDLNNVKYINDTYGTAEGDNQIKSAANILIKTQIDNTDIIRTDGNEFLIYMIGFEEKRVISYMRKLYKEFNNLPYEYGAAIGYSMRTDDLKTIDDVINEATLDMRSKKETREN